MAGTNVKRLLGQLREIFDVDAFLKQEVSPRTIRQYYTECAWSTACCIPRQARSIWP